MDYSRPELADRLAADYVAGTLRGPARRRFEALLPAHPLLRAAVRGWQDRLMPLTAPLPSVHVERLVSWRSVIAGEFRPGGVQSQIFSPGRTQPRAAGA